MIIESESNMHTIRYYERYYFILPALAWLESNMYLDDSYRNHTEQNWRKYFKGEGGYYNQYKSTFSEKRFKDRFLELISNHLMLIDFIDFLPDKTGIDPKEHPGQSREDDYYYPLLKADPERFFKLSYAADETISEQNIFENTKDPALWRELVLDMADSDGKLDSDDIKKLFKNPPVTYYQYLTGCRYRERYFLEKAEEFKKLVNAYQRPYREFKHLIQSAGSMSM